MGINSIRAYNLSPLVPRILNKTEVNIAYIFGQFLCLCSSSLIFLICGYFMTFLPIRDLFLKVKKIETVQVFFEDCVVLS